MFGADARQLEQSVATPHRQADEWRGITMNYMYFVECHGQRANDDGFIDFDVKTDRTRI